MSSKTKKELEKENIELKTKVKQLQYELADITIQRSNSVSKGENLDMEAFGIFKGDDKYKIAQIKYDLDGGCEVVNIEDVGKNPLPFANAYMRGTKELSDMMTKLKK